jgi:hypothetical protein
MEIKMITLKTLADATEQEVFDQVANHLLTQMKKSGEYRNYYDSSEYVTYDYVNCLYRSSDGLKCAAGCLIADDEYKPEFEQKSWRSLREEFPQMITMKHMDLIRQLQNIHDNLVIDDWKAALIEFSTANNLEWNFRG